MTSEKRWTRRKAMMAELIATGTPWFLAQEAVASTAMEHPEWDMDEEVGPPTGFLAAKADAFRCPRCDRISHNPNDVRERYCGACHDWTGLEEPHRS